jgi:hypothetical protein
MTKKEAETLGITVDMMKPFGVNASSLLRPLK